MVRDKLYSPLIDQDLGEEEVPAAEEEEIPEEGEKGWEEEAK